ncbi:MAG: aminotransferase class V-fold PLP-dependent enzyme [Treponema sp.]|nr:aminotransferase class V-fold PLP-dependent enzyme [Treponema sp.]
MKEPGRIYLNYAATSAVKAERVINGLTAYLAENRHISGGRNIGGLDDGALIHRARRTLAEFFAAPSTASVVFTSGVTLSLNMILGGLLKPGDHVLATHVEHNAAARPLRRLQQTGRVQVDFLPNAPDGCLDPALIKPYLRPNTRLLVMTGASNVLGTLQPWEACFAEAKNYGLFTLLDAAQTAGCVPLAFNEHTDALAFTGHKGLGGLAGTGGFILSKAAADLVEPWLCGGTGSASDSLDQPGFLPDKFESGTANVLGILSLALGVEEIQERGIEKIREREQELTRRFLDGARSIPGLLIYGTGDAEQSAPLVSINAPRDSPWFDNALLAQKLYDDYGIITRCGLHCSPLAHQCAGTFPHGALRFSFGYKTTAEEIDTALKALELCRAGA